MAYCTTTLACSPWACHHWLPWYLPHKVQLLGEAGEQSRGGQHGGGFIYFFCASQNVDSFRDWLSQEEVFLLTVFKERMFLATPQPLGAELCLRVGPPFRVLKIPKFSTCLWVRQWNTKPSDFAKNYTSNLVIPRAWHSSVWLFVNNKAIRTNTMHRTLKDTNTKHKGM